MLDGNHTTPRQYPGITVSSTFTDLEQHRVELFKAIVSQGFHQVAMENDSAKPIDVIDSSLGMVRDGSAYIGVISHKYGQTPMCPQRNPRQLSLTEIEFDEAQRLERPIVLFVMGDDHPGRRSDFEDDPDKQEKLTAFRERAKKIKPGSEVPRVYDTFNSLEEFSHKAIQALAGLRRYLEDYASSAPQPQPIDVGGSRPDHIPRPPALYAEPSYIGSHTFIGRQAQLETLSDWAMPADSHPVLLFEAIGGAGKSMLTWEWTKRYAPSIQNDWAGIFWYSFYQRGATMVDFCRRALAYMTCQPRTNFREKNNAELTELLIHLLQAKPWLLILDGLERVLVSYHRFDASQVRDEEAGTTDTIAQRDPCTAINPEDDDLLRALAAANPSKLLITSRLVPRMLLNSASQPIPGVLRVSLPGLRPMDAEALLRSCGVTGTSQAIQNYLKSHCDCHPLVIGALAGLINDYLPDRGNFDAWAADPSGGGQLNLSKLDLVQKRNHILSTALYSLPEDSRQLLSTLALLSEAVNYPTLCALNPSLSPIPEEVQCPKDPKYTAKWRSMTESEKKKAYEQYYEATRLRQEYEKALENRKKEINLASQALPYTVKDLERRGLLQYDIVERRYDLHPVVRGICAGGLRHEEKNLYGQRVVDHFSQKAQDPYMQAESLEDLGNALRIVRVLFQMGKIESARRFILSGNMLVALNRFEAHNEIITILRPFFSTAWTEMSCELKIKGAVALATRAAVALRRMGALQEAFDVSQTALRFLLQQGRTVPVCRRLLDLASTCGEQNHLALEERLLSLANHWKLIAESPLDDNRYLLSRFRQLSRLGRWTDAMSAWSGVLLDVREVQEYGIAMHHFAVHMYQRGLLTSECLAKALAASQSAKSALGIRNLCRLRGFWQLEQGDWESAKTTLRDAVVLAHKVGKIDRYAEICLAIAKVNLKTLSVPKSIAEQFTDRIDGYCHRALANLWFAIGNYEKAKKHARDAYRWAWADGTPYVHYCELEKTTNLLKQLGVDIPRLPHYDPSKDAKLPLEVELAEAFEKKRAEKSWPY